MELTDEQKSDIVQALIDSGMVIEDRHCFLMKIKSRGAEPLIVLGFSGEKGYPWLEDARLYRSCLRALPIAVLSDKANALGNDLSPMDKIAAFVKDSLAVVKAYAEFYTGQTI